LIPGYNGSQQSLAQLFKEADRIGYPVLIKASAGGGGKGMRVIYDRSRFSDELISLPLPYLSLYSLYYL
jgi:acetyl/propionyl-CoA carboxylase alpha subunit